MVGGTIDGMPHIYCGQELGTTESFGFSVYAGDVPSIYAYNSCNPPLRHAAGNVRVNPAISTLCGPLHGPGSPSPALRKRQPLFLKPDHVAAGNLRGCQVHNHQWSPEF